MRWGKLLMNAAVPAAILIAAWFCVPMVAHIPETLSGLRIYGLWAMLLLGALVSMAFRRGRVVYALLTLAVAYAGYKLMFYETMEPANARAVLAALSLFVPFNFAALSVLKERGTLNIYGLQRLGIIAAEVLVTLWIISSNDHTSITNWSYLPLVPNALPAHAHIPQAGLVMMALACAVTIVHWLIKRLPIDLAFAGSAAAMAIAIDRIKIPDAFLVFTAAATVILIVAVLQDTFRMAFHDELTGLSSRRDFNESLLTLGTTYAIAMVDVDHFKNFNDTYGHDLGDQVLKMVAFKLDQVGGGGKAYRYGGEEFTILFPNKSVDAAMPHLKELLKEVSDYKLAVRAPDRPRKQLPDKRKTGSFRDASGVSVTISIGVAERSQALNSAADVVRAADKALYRAKDGGRNQVRS